MGVLKSIRGPLPKKALFIQPTPLNYKHASCNNNLPTENIKMCLVNLAANGKYLEKEQPATAVEMLKGYLKATTKADIKIFDMEKERLRGGSEDPETNYGTAILNVIDKIKGFEPHIIGLSMKWGTLDAARQILATLRDNRVLAQEPLIVAGNTIPTFGPDHLLKEKDFRGALAVLGEGEMPLKEIIERASISWKLSDPSIYWGISGVQVKSGERPEVNVLNLDDYPFMTEENVPEMYENDAWSRIESSRGCQWERCSFCSIKELYGGGHGWRAFSNQWVLDRMERLIRGGKFKDDWFGFCDSEVFGIAGKMPADLFEQRIDRANELARGIGKLRDRYERYLKGKFTIGQFSIRPDCVYKAGKSEIERNKARKGVLELFKKAGLNEIYLGVEAGSQEQLNCLKKGVTLEEVEIAINILRSDLDIDFHAGYIMFKPTDNEQCLRDNIDFVKNSGLFGHDVYDSFRAQAGSELYNKMEKESFMGEFDLDQAGRPIDWDTVPHIGEIHKLFSKWKEQTSSITNFLNFSVNNNTTTKWVSKWISRLRTFNGNFLFEYVHSNESDRHKTYIDHLQKMSLLLDELARDLKKINGDDQMKVHKDELMANAKKLNKDLLLEVHVH
jgi:radical SAM superfamily enzyme YgiQ (UPF0313 family)